MLKKLLNKSLEFDFDAKKLKFNSINEVEFGLDGRTSVSTDKTMELMQYSRDQLDKESKKTSEVEKVFKSILTKGMEDPSSLDREMRKLKLNTFTSDQRWRDIIAAINKGGAELDPLRRIVLFRYMKYLDSFQDLIKQLLSGGKGIPLESPRQEKTIESKIITPATDDDEFKRMSKGEPVFIKIHAGTELNLLLATFKCKVVLNDKLQFIDQTGKYYSLGDDRNTIGRGTSNTVILSQNLREISRLHLVIESYDKETYQFIDMSSHGTFIPSKYLSAS